ncbi:MAG: response regulator transcription factor, partial [Candidatus Corynebacterium faecigallinarum]
MSISVIVVDDQAMVRQGFAALLNAQEDITVIADAEDGAQAVERVTRLQP